MRELDDEALGWFRRRLPWGSYGMLARASVTAPNLGVAMKRWCRHHNLLTEDIHLRLTSADGLAHIELEEHPQRHDLGRFREFCTVSILRNALGVACWLTDSRISLVHTRLHFAKPRHVDRDEAALQQMLQRALLLTVRPYRRDRLLVERVRQALAEHPEHGRNAEDLAVWLNMSARSLHRQLQEEGASLQQLKDSVRQQRAQDLLLRTRKPLKQIAFEVGFLNEKSFIRAFKSWTGESPEVFRSAGQLP